VCAGQHTDPSPSDHAFRRSHPAADLLATALVGGFLPKEVPEGQMMRTWLNSWAGIGHASRGPPGPGPLPDAVRRRGLAGDVLRRGPGARARHRDGLGADAVAGRPAGGVGDATPGRGGNALKKSAALANDPELPSLRSLRPASARRTDSPQRRSPVTRSPADHALRPDQVQRHALLDPGGRRSAHRPAAARGQEQRVPDRRGHASG